ncbi:hypothetical protein PMZ80_000632 [Knufia obscura]|uniref:DSBA-like thioredoxin domain-containing protein n=1 Tax=Knufia obscura TaxID=1635080 RepID=A0ABR0S1W8_9EURO|nr:hypothetical protein PMZ80_000632 [Knufia obscura]
MGSPILEFNYDISCPFAYIASTRIEALASRTGATLIWRPVLLGAIYRATSAPQGAGGSASDLHNPTKRAVTAKSMARTLQRYQIAYNPPPQHPRKTVNALRLLYAVDGEERRVLTRLLFRAYWVDGVDVSDDEVLLRIVRGSGIQSASKLSSATFADVTARRELEVATAEAVERGAFGVPGFWIRDAKWTDPDGTKRQGRFFWGQDRMHFVEAELLALQRGGDWSRVPELASLMPRCIASNKVAGRVKVEFWYDFSSPWAFLGWTQLQRLQRTSGPELEIVMKPFLLGILFRQIGAPNLPMGAVSPAKAAWSRQDHADWTRYWNAVNLQEGSLDKNVDFYWADVFPIRTPTVLRVAMADPSTVPLLYRACWEENANVSDESVLSEVLDKGGYNGADLLSKANSSEVKAKLREATAEAKSLGICGVPTYRVLRQNGNGDWVHDGNIVWGQDETNVLQDLIAGWDAEASVELAEPRKAQSASLAPTARL